MNKKAKTTETYNLSALKMAEKFKALGARTNDINRGFSYIEKVNPVVLEIGCGDGRDAKEILKKTNQYLGIDISSSMVKIAREYNPTGKFEVADIEEYSFTTKNIDLIFAFASLLHSDKESIKKILERAARALNSNGIFFISLKYDSYQEREITDHFGVRTFFFYTPEDIKELAQDLYVTVFEDFQEFQNQKWFTIILQKKLS